MRFVTIQVLQFLTATASVVLFLNESPYWLVAVIPWSLLCMLGIVATIPVFIVIGMFAGAAQADWMSDNFIIGLIFVTPTILAITISTLLKWKIRQINI